MGDENEISTRIISILNENPEYLDSLKKIIELDDINPLEHAIIVKLSPTGRGFYKRHYKGDMEHFETLENNGIIEKFWEHNGDAAYCLKYPDEMRAAIEQYLNNRTTNDASTQPQKLPSDIFDCIIGYDDVKELFRMSLQSTKPYNILMVGPPASAKSLFLLEVSRLQGAVYALGSSSSKAGLATLLIEKTREVRLNLWAFAAANDDSRIPSEVLSRFEVLFFQPYNKREFIETGTQVLVMREEVPKQLANYIAKQVWQKGNQDIRRVIRIGRICKSKVEVDRVLKILQKHSRVRLQ
ncbi:MAG: hypothetical protein QXU67_07005 [Candidatus Bathyarchaeia archaeon]